jgi:hypothetical protein
MARCLTCDHPVPADRERVGARCPSCRLPLYEPAGRVARPAREGEPSCQLHEGMESVGVCLRCGGYVCETCRTRWHGQVLCPACVSKALATSEATPGQPRERRRQAVAAAACGAAAWAAGALAVAVLTWYTPDGPSGVVVVFVGFLVLAAGVFVAAAGAGQAVAALRGGGPHQALAFAGLAVSGLYAAVALGAGALALWQG